jgi:thioredoxin-like negative regulator of GroEL
MVWTRARRSDPALEAAVVAAKGKVRMAKVNVDENQAISAQLRIQSIPTVYAFWQGKPVDGFQGAIPGSEIKEFVDRLSALAGDGGLADAIEAAEEMLTEGAAVDAADTFAAILGEEPENAAGLWRARPCAHRAGQSGSGRRFLTAAPAAIAKSVEIEAARAQLDLARQAQTRVRSVSCRLLSLPTRPTIRRASILRWRCTQMGRWTKPWTNCSTCSAATGSGTMVPPRPSFSPSSKR